MEKAGRMLVRDEATTGKVRNDQKNKTAKTSSKDSLYSNYIPVSKDSSSIFIW